MALSRLGNTRRSENFTWPGFVDALASLLMVIIFVLMVFVLIQANLVYRVSGQDATLGEMRQQLASLSELLNIERRASADLAADLAQLQIQLDSSETERGALTEQLALVQAALGTRTSELTALTTKQAETEAALNAARDALDERLRALQMVEGQLALTEARNRTQQQKMQDLEAQTTASKAEVAQMTLVLAGLRQRIEELSALLAEKDQQAKDDQIAIANLGKSLNNALASRVQELQQFRSEFFGRLRDVLKAAMMCRLSATGLCFSPKFCLPRVKPILLPPVNSSFRNWPSHLPISRQKFQMISIGYCKLMAIPIICRYGRAAMLITGIYRPNAPFRLCGFWYRKACRQHVWRQPAMVNFNR